MEKIQITMSIISGEELLSITRNFATDTTEHNINKAVSEMLNTLKENYDIQ
jgi:hypothetical protein